MNQYEPQELKNKLLSQEDIVILDVRESEEFAVANIGGHHIPLSHLPDSLEQLDRSKEIVVICHHGIRSQQAAMYLLARGFTHVSNLVGGIDRWSLEVDSSVPRY